MFSWLFSEPLPAGTPAPDFSLPDDQGRTVTLSALRGKPVVLVFYPGDDTPGCTRQLCEFRDSWSAVQSSGAAVFGISPQSTSSHVKFSFPFPLLVDRGQKVAALYNAKGIIVKRTVYLIGPDGQIVFSRRGKPTPEEVMEHA
jgi:peroxiredoxin Q/BCP